MFKVVLFFDTVAEILKCDHSSERYGTFLSRSAVCFSVHINVLSFIFPYLQVVLLLLLLDPIECLLLWINTQWIPTGLGGQDTILNGQLIRRETLRGPATDLHIISKESVQLERLTYGDAPV